MMAMLLALPLLSVLAQAPATLPTTPEGCLKATRDFVVSEQRALKQITAEAIRKIDADKVVLASKCAAQFNVATVPDSEIAALIALYGEAAQPALAKAALDRGLSSKTLSAKSRAEVLSQAVISGLREPKSPERNARLEQLRRRTGSTGGRRGARLQDQRAFAYERLLPRRRHRRRDHQALDLADRTAKTFTPAQRTQYGATIVNAHINMAEAVAGRGQNDRAKALLTEAKSGWAEIRNVDRMLDPVIARYALVGKVGAPISAPRWLNAPAGTTLPMTGAVTLLEFTAHWCGPCKESYPGVKRLLAKYGPQGFRVVLATELYGYFGTERPLSPEAEFERDRDYFAHEGLTVPVAVADPRQMPVRGADGNFAAKPSTNDTAYEVGGIPQIHIIDKQGRIRLIMVGYDDANEKSLAALIEQLLKER